EPGRVGLELLEIPVQVREGVFLDLRGQLAQVLPIGHAGDRLVAVLAHPPDEAVVGGLVQLEGDELRGPPFGVGGTGHGGPPLRTWAMWMTFIGSFRRSITPLRWSRQDMSAETMYSTSWRWKSWTRSDPILAETASSVTQKLPPKPQHSSGRSISTSSSPLTLPSKSRVFEKYGSFTSSDGRT